MPTNKIKMKPMGKGMEIPKASLKMQCTGSGERYKSEGSSKSDDKCSYPGNIKE